MEQDPEAKGTGNSYDYGARMYDPRLGRWLSLDPLKAIYPSLSPYCYAGNTPIVAKDPDGNLIIFVNGFVCAGGAVPGRDYWYNKNTKSYEFEEAAIAHFGGDRNTMFVDGSCTGLTQGLNNLGLSMADGRYDAGYKLVTDNIETFRAALAKGEKIHIVSHSMGGAYSEGMIHALIENGLMVEDAVHFAVADAADVNISDTDNKDLQKKIWSVHRTQLNTSSDQTIEGEADPGTSPDDWKMPGVDLYGEVKVNGKKMLPKADDELRKNYNYHDWTKTDKDAWGAVKDLQSMKPEHFKSVSMNGWMQDYFYFKIGINGYKFNRIDIGSKSYSYEMESTKKENTNIYTTPCEVSDW